MEPQPLDPDRALVAKCLNPDSDEFEAAFEAIYHRYRDRAYSIAYRITGTSADAMDVVQETFSLVFGQIASFRGEALFSTWLFRIVVNCSLDSRRQGAAGIRRLTGSLSQLPDGAEPLDRSSLSLPRADQTSELSEHVHQCIRRLNPKLAAILVLRYIESPSYEDLCATLDLSMGTVKSRLGRAHVALQAALAGTLEPFGYKPDTDGNYSLGCSDEGREQTTSEGVA